MRPQEPTKLDLSNDCPYPCRWRGRLFAVVLTEALGCLLCQQMFVDKEDGQAIEQLSSSYPYKLSCRWTDYYCWLEMQPSLGCSYLRIISGIIVVLSIGWLWLALRSLASLSMVILIVLMGLLVTSYETINNVIGNNFLVSLSVLMQTLWQWKALLIYF